MESDSDTSQAPQRAVRTRRRHRSLGASTPFSVRRYMASVGALGALSLALLTGCGGGSDSDASSAAKLSVDKGCTSCHGDGGQGGVGPKWTGLAGSSVTLDDGTVVTADETYIRKAITDPGAQVVKGYSVAMPTARLSAAEVDQLVDYVMSMSG